MKELQLTWDKENDLLAQDENGKWWWRDETDDINGPYDTRAEADACTVEFEKWLKQVPPSEDVYAP